MKTILTIAILFIVSSVAQAQKPNPMTTLSNVSKTGAKVQVIKPVVHKKPHKKKHHNLKFIYTDDIQGSPNTTAWSPWVVEDTTKKLDNALKLVNGGDSSGQPSLYAPGMKLEHTVWNVSKVKHSHKKKKKYSWSIVGDPNSSTSTKPSFTKLMKLDEKTCNLSESKTGSANIYIDGEMEPRQKDYKPDTIPVIFKEIIIPAGNRQDGIFYTERLTNGYIVWQTKHNIVSYNLMFGYHTFNDFYETPYEDNSIKEKFLYLDKTPITNKVIYAVKR